MGIGLSCSLKDVAAAAGVSQPSALRIAYTMVQAGSLVRKPRTKGYRLGPNAISTGLRTFGAVTLTQICETYLADLRDKTDETIKLAVV
jgi:DNA-binding IclR family transcriptional regulator